MKFAPQSAILSHLQRKLSFLFQIYYVSLIFLISTKVVKLPEGYNLDNLIFYEEKFF